MQEIYLEIALKNYLNIDMIYLEPSLTYRIVFISSLGSHNWVGSE